MRAQVRGEVRSLRERFVALVALVRLEAEQQGEGATDGTARSGTYFFA